MMHNLGSRATPIEVTRIRPIRETATVTDPRQENTLRLTQVAIGRSFSAQVERMLTDGTFMIRPFSQNNFELPALRMQLPSDTQLGSHIQLTILNTEPLSLALDMPSQQDQLTQLSHTGKWMARLTHEVANTTVQVNTPFPSTDTTPSEMAKQLRQTLEQSGIFYESHLKQWVNGERELHQIVQESHTHRPSQEATSSLQDPNPRLAAQLHMLSNGKINFECPHPDSALKSWRVESRQEDANPQPHDADNSYQACRSTLRLELPHLGSVFVQLQLHEQNVHVHIQTSPTQDLGILRTHQTQLAQDLQALGLELQSLRIDHDKAF